MRIPDNYDLFCKHQDEQDNCLKRLPVCCECGEPIQDDFLYCIDDELFCKECMEDNFEKSVEDYMKE